MCISTIGDHYRTYSIVPEVIAEGLRDKIVDEEDDSLAINIQSRLLFIAQIIVSIVALPLTLLAMIIFPAIALCVEGKEAAWKELVQMGAFEILHLALIPTALIAAFAPPEKKWDEPAKSLNNLRWLNDCLTDADTACENAAYNNRQERGRSWNSGDDERTSRAIIEEEDEGGYRHDAYNNRQERDRSRNSGDNERTSRARN